MFFYKSTDDETDKDICYLIKEDWFSKYKEIYLYNKINEYLSNSSIKRENFISKKDKIICEIYNKYKDEFLKKLTEDNGEYFALQNDDNNFNVEFKLSEDEKEIIFLYKYSIINEKIFDILTNNYNNTDSLGYLVSSKNLIIKYKETNMIIGVLDDTKDNLLIPRFIIQYNKKYEMNQDFLFISVNDYKSFEKNLNLDGKKIKKMDKKIVYIIDKFKYIKNYNIDNNNNDLNYFHENIKLLFYLYGNYEELNYIIQLSNKQIEKKYYYIINKKYINKIKEIFCYNKFFEELK